MPSLNDEHKLFIVQQLAMFERPQAVCDLVKENFGLEIERSHVFYYELSNPKLPPKWKEIFENTRKNFLENVSDIPIANKSFRLRELDRLYQKQKSSKVENVVEARATLEQAAKESGDVFTNKQKVEHKGEMEHIYRVIEPGDDVNES